MSSSKRSKSNGFRIYPTYHYRDQDPMIQEALDAAAAEAKARDITTKEMIKTACELSRVHKSTPRNWQTRKSKSFKGATMNAWLRAMDCRLGIVHDNVKRIR